MSLKYGARLLTLNKVHVFSIFLTFSSRLLTYCLQKNYLSFKNYRLGVIDHKIIAVHRVIC